MTNFQQLQTPEQRLLQQRLLLGLPIGVGVLIAALVVGTAAVPQWVRQRTTSERIATIREREQLLPLLRAELAQAMANEQVESRRRDRILALIQGSGEFNTFLAQLDREARRSGVQLDLFEPLPPAPPVQPTEQPAGEGGEAPADADAQATKPPLEAAGLSAETVLLSAQGSFPSLLAFMRSVERLSVLVVPSNFSISLVEVPPQPDAPAPPADARKPTVPELKLQLTYYSPSPAPAEDAAAEAEPAA
jgi:type IV pilus assembly protein PilO